RRGAQSLLPCGSSTSDGEWRFESASCGRSLKLPPSGGLVLVLVGLPPQAELLDAGAVALEVALLQVLQEPAPATDELEHAAARVVIFRVRAQVLGQLVDAGGEERDLHVRGAGVLAVAAVLADDFLFRFLGEGQVRPPLTRLRSPSPPRGSTRERPRGGLAAKGSNQAVFARPRAETVTIAHTVQAAVAAGHPATVEAGVEVLEAG